MVLLKSMFIIALALIRNDPLQHHISVKLKSLPDAIAHRSLVADTTLLDDW